MEEAVLKDVITINIDGVEYVYKRDYSGLNEFFSQDLEFARYIRVNRLGFNNHYLQYLYGVDASIFSESLTPI